MTFGAAAKASGCPRRKSLLPLLFAIPILWLVAVQVISKTTFSAQIYNAVIAQMTSQWYAAVLSDLPAHSTVLDVGIGTAGALLKNNNVIVQKSLSIYGVDVSKQYMEAARRAVSSNKLEEHVHIVCQSIYDVPSIQTWLRKSSGKAVVDAVYFSGSFSLLPDPLEALNAAQQLLKPGGTIYITQTYASSLSRMGEITKPLIKYFTTIDFGQLVSNEKAMKLFEASNDLTVVTHEQLQQTNAFGLSPPAFLTVLRVPSNERGRNQEDENCLEQ